MDYIRFAIQNPVKVTVGVLLTVLGGFIAASTIPIQLVPTVDRPVITVETNWTGRSPEEIEQQVIEEQEDKLKGIAGLKKMTATASQGKAEIELEFFIGVNTDRALQEVSDKLREVPEYPDDVDEPVIAASSSDSENAIAWIILESTDPAFDIQGFHDTVDRRVKPHLERVPGISRINVYGGREREVHIQVHPDRLADRGITFNELLSALQRENVNRSAGDLADGRLDIRIRMVGQYDNLDDIRNTVIRYEEGGPVRIADLGDAVLTFEKRRSFVRANGKPSLAINAIRETGANVVQIMEGLRRRIDEVNTNILPAYGHGLAMRQVYDETIYIHDAINLALNNVWIGGTLAALVLLLFLRTIRPTTIIAFAIPISVIGTFVAMAAFGRTLNVISLAGLAFAVGMVVDNAIVVLENIDRHLSMGKPPREAAYDAAKEVWGAILASTLTTLAVFIPVLTVQEEAGQLFRDISLAICAAVTLSLIVSITVIPTASARWLRPRDPNAPQGPLKTLFGLTTGLGKLTTRYAGFLHALAAPAWPRRLTALAIVAGMTAAAAILTVTLKPPTSYLPKGNKNLIFGMMLTPPAYNIDHAQSIGERIETGLKPYWQADTTQQATAIQPVIDFASGQPFAKVPAINNYFFVSFTGTIFMGCSSQDKELIRPLEPVLGGAMSTIPGSFGFARQTSIFGRGASTANSVQVEVIGNDLNQIRDSATIIYHQLAQRFGYQKVRPDPMNFNLPGPEMRFKIDQVRAKDLKLDVDAVGLALQGLIDGVTVGDYRIGGESIDLLLIRHPDYTLTPDNLGHVPVAVYDREGRATVVPAASLVTVEHTDAPQQIKRIEQMRAITFEVTAPDEMPLETAIQEIQNLNRDLRDAGQVPRDVELNLAGTADQLNQVRAAMLGEWHGLFSLDTYAGLLTSRLFLALVVTYLLMAALFESFLYPFVILFSVPLATVGGVIGLAIVHYFDPTQQLDMLTMLGFVILIGVVVNNAILIVHQALNFMRGVSDTPGITGPLNARDAIRESVRTRFRPVFMTTLTSVCGMLPLVLRPGSGSELYRGLGGVVVGGLAVSTVFTLLIVPLVFGLTIQARDAAARLLTRTVPTPR